MSNISIPQVLPTQYSLEIEFLFKYASDILLEFLDENELFASNDVARIGGSTIHDQLNISTLLCNCTAGHNYMQILQDTWKIIRPTGKFAHIFLGNQSLKSLRVFAAQNAPELDLNDLACIKNLGESCLSSGFERVALHSDTVTIQYSSVTQLIEELKFLGVIANYEYNNEPFWQALELDDSALYTDIELVAVSGYKRKE